MYDYGLTVFVDSKYADVAEWKRAGAAWMAIEGFEIPGCNLLGTTQRVVSNGETLPDGTSAGETTFALAGPHGDWEDAEDHDGGASSWDERFAALFQRWTGEGYHPVLVLCEG